MSHLVTTDPEAAFICGRVTQNRRMSVMPSMYSSDSVSVLTNTGNVELTPAFAMTAVDSRLSDHHFNGHAIHGPGRPMSGTVAAYDSLIDLSPSGRHVLSFSTDTTDANTSGRYQMFDSLPTSTMQYCLESQSSGVGYSTFVSTSGSQGII